MEQLLKQLNPHQREAVTTIDGPLLIIAGAGSGKTGVITRRIAYMIHSGIDPASILAMTFTNKAAGEMLERVRDLGGAIVGNRVEPTISTFHAFGLAVLRRYGRMLGYRSNFTVYDTGDQIALLKEAARELSIDPDELEIFSVLQLFSAIKTERRGWKDTDPMLRELHASYQAHLLTFNAVDFDDLIARPLELFRNHDNVREHYTDRYRYILVDEFQDTSSIQYSLLRQLADAWRNVCVVGDDDQSIYSWRGADYSNLQSFEKDFAEFIEIKLERNYRSTGPILNAANALIAHNANRKEKSLWTSIDGGNLLELSYPESDEEEARFIAEKIKILSYQESLDFDAFGILMRTNGQARLIEEALLEADIPYKMSGGQSFFQRKEIKDIAGYLRVIVNPDDDVNLLRTINTPRRGIGRKAVEILHSLADERRLSLYSTIAMILHGEIPANAHKLAKGALVGLSEYAEIIESYRQRFEESNHLAATTERLVEDLEYWGYLVQEFQRSERAAKAKWKNIGFFLRSIDRYETNPEVLSPTLIGYLNRISLQTRDELDGGDQRGTVHLMTIHAAKGLEFEIVFLAGVEAGLLPHARSVEENDGDVDEERRLFYVAITRARRRLHMTSARRRMIQNETVESVPSPFLAEIPHEFVRTTTNDPAAGMETPNDPFAAIKARFGD